MPDRFALIVATDTYEDPKLRRLRAPAHDAEALADVLRDPEVGDFEVSLATNENDAALRRRIATFFSDRARDSLLLLPFSCHGLKDDSGQLYFAAADTEVAHLDATAIPAEFVSRQMARSRSNNVLMLLDCCYSGAIARGLRFRAGDSVDVNDQLGGSGRAIITASNAMEYAFEGDELTGEGRPSVFTSAIVKALVTGEADRDQDSWISVRELYDYVRDEVREITPNQRPNMISHLEGELYVARSRWVAPAELPRELLDGLGSPSSAIREGAVNGLAELLHGRDRSLADAARRRLESVAASDDSRRVSAAAAAALAAPPPPAPVATPPPTAAAPPLAAAPPEPEPVAAAPEPEPAVAAPPEPAPAVAAPPEPAPAVAPPTRRGSVAVLIAGLALIVAWFLPWVWGDPVPTIDNDVEFDDRVGFVAVLVTGFLAVAAGGLALRARRIEVLWLALALLAACSIGAVVAFVDHHDNSDYGAGVILAGIGSLVLLVLGARQTLASPARTSSRITTGDAVAGAGGLLIVIGVLVADHSSLGWTAGVPTLIAGLVAISGVAFQSRLISVMVGAAGAFALGAAGMADGPSRGYMLIGGLMAALGGAMSLRARSQL